MDTNTEILNRVRLLMNYNSSMTLNENLFEQNSFKYDTSYKTTPRDATSVADPRTKQIASTSKTDIGFGDSPKRIMDIHDQLSYASLGTYVIPLVGPFLSIGFDVLNSLLYLSEGDEFMFGLTLALSIIPGDDILKIVSKRYNVSRESVKSLIKKIISKAGKFTEEEIKLIKGIGEESNEIAKLTRKYLNKLLWKSMFKTMSLKQIITYIYLWSKNNPKKYQIYKLFFKFGTIKVTAEQLMKIFGIIENKSNEVLPSREEIENTYIANKDSINQQITNSLLPYSEEEQLSNIDTYMKSKYNN